MTDKEINDFLINIEKDESQTSIINLGGDVSAMEKADILNYEKEYTRHQYLSSELKLIKISLSNDNGLVLFTLTKKGRKVLRLGGWLKYLERKDKIEAKKELKEDYELKIAEFQAKNPRLPYFISICGLIISFMAFINSCNSDKQKPKHNQQIQETQKEAPILRDTDSVIYTNPL